MLNPFSRTPIGRMATVLALWLVLGPALGAPLRAGENLAAIRGLLFKEDETTRLPGGQVTAINVSTGRRYVSSHTGENGAYEIADLPAGTYDLTIETDDRLYVTDNLVDLAENQRLYISFAVMPRGANAKTSEEGEAKMTFTNPNAVPSASEKRKKKGFWNSAGGITIITILVAGAVGAGVAAQHD